MDFLEKIFKISLKEKTWKKLATLATLHWYCKGPEPIAIARCYDSQACQHESVAYLSTNHCVNLQALNWLRVKVEKKGGMVCGRVWKVVLGFFFFFWLTMQNKDYHLITCSNHCSNYVEQRLIVNTTLPQSQWLKWSNTIIWQNIYQFTIVLEIFSNISLFWNSSLWNSSFKYNSSSIKNATVALANQEFV